MLRNFANKMTKQNFVLIKKKTRFNCPILFPRYVIMSVPSRRPKCL